MTQLPVQPGRDGMSTPTTAQALRLAESIPETPENFRCVRELIAMLKAQLRLEVAA